MLFAVDKDKIKKLRLERGLTLEQMGEAVYIKAGALHYIETGVREPSVKLLARIAHFFGEKIDDFVKAVEETA